jgi:hypothetical protein
VIHYGKETKLQPQAVIDRAIHFFGPTGVGLRMVDQGPACARFEGGGGYVSIACCKGEKRTLVDLEAREWEHYAGKFIGKL